MKSKIFFLENHNLVLKLVPDPFLKIKTEQISESIDENLYSLFLLHFLVEDYQIIMKPMC